MKLFTHLSIFLIGVSVICAVIGFNSLIEYSFAKSAAFFAMGAVCASWVVVCLIEEVRLSSRVAKKITESLKERAYEVLLGAATESLKHGAHDGPCDNADEDGEVSFDAGPCEKHLAMSELRHQALKDAVERVKELAD